MPTVTSGGRREWFRLVCPMRKFRLNRDRDEPASGPNFLIAGYTTGMLLELPSVVPHPLLQPRRQSSKREERKGNRHHFQVVLCAFLRRIQCID
jgi:hypothetical protein